MASVRFGRRLRGLRERRELTQAQVAERADLDVNYISQIERGRRDPSLSSLGALAKAFGISVGELLTDAEDKARAPTTDAMHELEVELEAVSVPVLREILVVVRAMKRAVAGK